MFACVLIEEGVSLVFQTLQELFDHRDLLYMITWREIRVKYKQSVMGMLWAILMPCIIVSAGLVVRYAFAMVAGKPFAIADLTSVAVKAAPWAFFVSALEVWHQQSYFQRKFGHENIFASIGISPGRGFFADV